MLNFDIETQTEGSSALVSLRGDLDVQVAERVATAITELEEGRPDLLVLDLSRLSFLDSSGMGVIAAAHGRAVEASRRFYVVDPPPGVRRAFELSKLNEVIDVVKELSEVYP